MCVFCYMNRERIFTNTEWELFVFYFLRPCCLEEFPSFAGWRIRLRGTPFAVKSDAARPAARKGGEEKTHRA